MLVNDNKNEIIKKIDYSYYYFGSLDKNERIIIIIGEVVKVHIQKFIFFEQDNKYSSLSTIDSTEFIKRLNKIDLLNWKDVYDCSGCYLMDEVNWHIELFTNLNNKIEKKGDNAFPKNFKEFQELIIWLKEKIKSNQ